MLCDAFAGYLRIRDELSTEQLVTLTGETNYPTPNPLCALLRGQTKAVRELLSDFGMTPASRSSLTGSTSIEGPQEERDPLAELMKGFAPDAATLEPAKKPEDTMPANGRKKPAKKAAKRKPAKPKPAKREK